MTSPLWTSMRVDDDFTDVKIIDLDVARTTWSRVHESMRVMHLKLSRHPPDIIWERFFFEERDTRINARRRGLWIENGYILFDCLPSEIENCHLPDIRKSLEHANRKYHDYVAQRRREREQAHHAEERELIELEQLRKRIRFDA